MFTMNGSHWVKFTVLLLIFLSFSAIIVRPAASRTVEEVVRSLKGLSPEARQKRLEEGARAEGKAIYYGTIQEDDARELLAGFKRKYPFLQTGHLRLSNTRLLGKISTEAKAGRFETDVIQTSGLFGDAVVRGGLVVKYVSPETRHVGEEFIDQSGYWTAMQQVPVVLGYNTRLVTAKDVPKNYEDLLAPKYRGRLVLDSDDQDVLAGLVDVWGEEKAKNFFKGLAASQTSLRRGRTLIGQLLAAGEFSIALFLHSHIPLSLKANRAPVEFVYLPPYITKLVPIFLAKHSPHPHSAVLLYDYLLSKDAQKLMVEKLDRVAVRKDVEGRHPEIVKEKYSVVNPSIEGSRIRQYQKFFTDVFGGS